MSENLPPAIGIIGGSGLYDLEGFENREEITLQTPFGQPSDALVTGTLTFTASSYNSSTPTCGGSYHIDPYYPTLSLLTVDVSVSSIDTPNGSPLFIVVHGAGGTFYPFLGGSMSVSGGSAIGTSQIYCTPGSSITSVSIVDLNGTVVATGK